MKRDMDLIRKILLEIEANPDPNRWISLSVDGYNPKEISYHVKLLAEAGLIEAKNVSNTINFEWKPICLTWEGHEFLEASRDEGLWEKAKSLILRKGGTLSFEVLKQALIEIMKGQVFS